MQWSERRTGSIHLPSCKAFHLMHALDWETTDVPSFNYRSFWYRSYTADLRVYLFGSLALHHARIWVRGYTRLCCVRTERCFGWGHTSVDRQKIETFPTKWKRGFGSSHHTKKHRWLSLFLNTIDDSSISLVLVYEVSIPAVYPSLTSHH